MTDNANAAQRDLMRSRHLLYGGDVIAVCDAYAAAERAGQVARLEEDRGEFAESYAQRLWEEGKARGRLG